MLLIALLLSACGAKGDGISFALGKKDTSSPPFVCRISVPHSEVGSLRQERAQLDTANALLQFCMAQWEAGGGN